MWFYIFPPDIPMCVREWNDSHTTSLISVTSSSHPHTEDAALHTATVNTTSILRKNVCVVIFIIQVNGRVDLFLKFFGFHQKYIRNSQVSNLDNSYYHFFRCKYILPPIFVITKLYY